MANGRHQPGPFDLRWMFRQVTLAAILLGLFVNWQGIFRSNPVNVGVFLAMTTVAGAIAGGFVHCLRWGAVLGFIIGFLWASGANYVPW